MMDGLKNLIDADTLRQRYARVNQYDVGKEMTYQVKRSSLAGMIRKAAEFGADFVSGLVTDTVGDVLEFMVGREIAQNLGLFAGTLTKGIAGILTMGAAGAISAAFAQMDFVHQKQNLRDLYAEELGAKLGKPARAVTVRDMEAVAEENPILAQELKRATKQRNFAVPLAVAATLASFAATTFFLPGAAGLSGFLMKVPVSMAAYVAVKIPSQILGNKLFGLYDESPNDRIVSIKRAHEKGREITAEDVLPLFAKNNQFVDAPALEFLARDINEGRVSATALVFARQGSSPDAIARKEPEAVGASEPEQPAARMEKPFQDRLASSRRSPSYVQRLTAEAAVEAALTV